MGGASLSASPQSRSNSGFQQPDWQEIFLFASRILQSIADRYAYILRGDGMKIGKAAIFSGNCNFPTESRPYPDTPRPVMNADLPTGGAAETQPSIRFIHPEDILPPFENHDIPCILGQ